MPFLTIPSLTKNFLTTCAVLLTLILSKNASSQTNIMPKYRVSPRIVSSVDSCKNTVLLDTNQQMIALQAYLTSFYTEFKYEDSTNFTKKILYTQPVAYLRLPAAKALQKAINMLKTKGLTVKIYDAYRPYSVTVQMWNLVPDSRYTANPLAGSSHNRGTAIDLTLADLKTGVELEMPTAFDDFSSKAHHNYMHLPPKVLANRKLLKLVMEKAGFIALETEWWHYSLPGGAEKFDLLDFDFEQMKEVARQGLR